MGGPDLEAGEPETPHARIIRLESSRSGVSPAVLVTATIDIRISLGLLREQKGSWLTKEFTIQIAPHLARDLRIGGYLPVEWKETRQ